MVWKIKISVKADKNLEKLNPRSRKLIQDYIDNKILKLKHPKHLGKAMHKNLKGLWRYRVEDFRIICQIQEQQLIILVVKIGYRREYE